MRYRLLFESTCPAGFLKMGCVAASVTSWDTGVQRAALYGTCACLSGLTETVLRSSARLEGVDSWQQSAVFEHMQLSAEAEGLMQQDCGLAIAGNSVKLRKLSNARIKWMLSLFMVFMNPTG